VPGAPGLPNEARRRRRQRAVEGWRRIEEPLLSNRGDPSCISAAGTSQVQESLHVQRLWSR
jgi:hypothetical protein